MVIINDVMAYMFGFFMGRTPLIKLSPKKTWEGFIGGGISTVFMSLGLAYIMCQYPYFVCPIEYSTELERMTMGCEPSAVFRPQEYSLPQTLTTWRRILGMKETLTFYPFFIHCFFMSLFASIIGPFGGFFASGFKRAFKIKDFGDIIPGHGGIMDRFDCQFLMATFVNVYIHSFINIPTPGKVRGPHLSVTEMTIFFLSAAATGFHAQTRGTAGTFPQSGRFFIGSRNPTTCW